ncbi:MAG TPA: mycothiol conjugate amidase Mca [Microthrixaceae bacterium]|nr:mycothiol conjugate amidase Mca [Microthrixaceae bacterium]
MADPLRLLSVHAHPDDEASKGASLVAMYRAQGIGATLVCCTGGELGEILNPALNRPEVLDRLAEIRMEELKASVAVIGYDRWDLLGYRDSGMPDTAENADPQNFANAPIDEATGRLVEIIRRDRPQVIVTYSDDQGGYPHPDHLRVHDISVLAFDRAGSPDWYPDAGEPFAPSKLYYSLWAKERVLAIHEKMLEMGIESPFQQEWLDRFTQDHRITTQVDVREWFDVREQALRAHATQVDPDSAFWFALPNEVAAEVYPYDDYILARSTIEPELPETDLFSGLR